MSELTLCNFCSMQIIKSHAEAENQQVVTRKSTSKLSGVNVFVLPPGVEMTKDVAGIEADDDDDFTKKYFASWFMKLTDHCVC